MTIPEIIKRMVGEGLKPLTGQVIEVNGIKCDVRLLSDETTLYDVKLATQENGIVYTPKIDSFVTVTLLNEVEAFVIGYGEIQSIKFGDGSFDGLVKINDLVNKINTIESDINTLKNVFINFVPVPSDGGAALKTAASTWAGQTITETQKSDIENDKIAHGEF